jgi:RNA polymerase sigma-70 factor (ECF subfamily)
VNFTIITEWKAVMDQKLEAEIVARVLKGDRQAYALLVEKYKSPIYNLAYRMTGNLGDAEDLTQEIFIRAYQYLWRYDTRKKLFSWLYTIAFNLIKNHYKKNKKHNNSEELSAHSLADNSPSPEAKLIETQEITACLLCLQYEPRALLIMKYQQGLSFEEIAKITGKSLSAVKMRIYRGLEKLKELMKEQDIL